MKESPTAIGGFAITINAAVAIRTVTANGIQLAG